MRWAILWILLIGLVLLPFLLFEQQFNAFAGYITRSGTSKWMVGSAIFGLLGAMVAYGRSRGGSFGVAVFRQYGQWALIMFIFGFFMAGVNNWGHLGGFGGGYLVALAMGPLDRAAERGLDRIAAFAAIAVTLIAFLMALWTGFRLFR